MGPWEAVAAVMCQSLLTGKDGTFWCCSLQLRSVGMFA